MTAGDAEPQYKTGDHLSTLRGYFAVAFTARKPSEDSSFLWTETLRLLNLSNYRDKHDIVCSQSSTTGQDGNQEGTNSKTCMDKNPHLTLHSQKGLSGPEQT